MLFYICSELGADIRSGTYKYLLNQQTLIILAKSKGIIPIRSEKTAVPKPLMNHSLASASSAAYVLYQKYVDAVLLYRQEKAWEQLGIGLSRATMANWIIRCRQDYFTSIIKHLQKQLLKREIIYCNETPI